MNSKYHEEEIWKIWSICYFTDYCSYFNYEHRNGPFEKSCHLLVLAQITIHLF